MTLPEIHPYGVEEYPKIGNYLPGFIGYPMILHSCLPPESVFFWGGYLFFFDLIYLMI